MKEKKVWMCGTCYEWSDTKEGAECCEAFHVDQKHNLKRFEVVNIGRVLIGHFGAKGEDYKAMPMKIWVKDKIGGGIRAYIVRRRFVSGGDDDD